MINTKNKNKNFTNSKLLLTTLIIWLSIFLFSNELMTKCLDSKNYDGYNVIYVKNKLNETKNVFIMSGKFKVVKIFNKEKIFPSFRCKKFFSLDNPNKYNEIQIVNIKTLKDLKKYVEDNELQSHLGYYVEELAK